MSGLRGLPSYSAPCGSVVMASAAWRGAGRVSPLCRAVWRRGCSSIAEKSQEEAAYASIRRGIAPATGRRLEDIAADLWGHTPPSERASPGERSARKLLKRPLRGHLYAAWYPPRLESYEWNQFKLSEIQERRKAKLRQLRANGKGPPKKGSGKRSS